MTRHAWFAGVIFAALLTCPPAFVAGQEAEPKPEKKARKAKPKKEKSLLRGEYQIMASVLEMDEAEKARLVEALKANQASLAEWKDGSDGRKLAELMKAHAEARKAKDKEKTKQVAKEMAPLKDALAAIGKSNRQRIMGLLTDEQRARWAGFGMARTVLRKFSKAELTDDQKTRIKDLCLAAVKAEPLDEDDKKARGAAYRKLDGVVEKEVLTDAQRESMKKPSPRKKKDPKDADKGKEAGKPE